MENKTKKLFDMQPLGRVYESGGDVKKWCNANKLQEWRMIRNITESEGRTY